MNEKLIYYFLIFSLTFLFSCKTEKTYKESFEISESDFQNYPIWENCIFNGLAAINNNSNITESTFTPYLKKELINPEHGFYYVKAKFRFADLTEYNGFLIPIHGIVDSSKIGNMEPTIFYNGSKLTFWKGVLSIDSLELNDFYERVKKTKSDIFPITFFVDSTIMGKKIEGMIPGIGHCIDYNCDTIRFKK